MPRGLAGAAAAQDDDRFLAATMGEGFADHELVLILHLHGLMRAGLRGNRARGLATTEEIRRGLPKVATVARRNDPPALRTAIEAAPGAIRGWYLPRHLSRQIGPPELQGMDPALLARATPAQIADAARAALTDPLLASDGTRTGRLPDLASETLIASVRDAYEVRTGKRATAWRKDTGSSAFVRVLSIVAGRASWRVSEEQLLDRARRHLRKHPRDTPMAITVGAPEK